MKAIAALIALVGYLLLATACGRDDSSDSGSTNLARSSAQ